MSFLTVQVNYALRGDKEPATMKFPVEVEEGQMEHLFPPLPPGGSAGWAYWRETVELIAPLVKRELFPDETTPVESVDDFQRLGVWHLQFFIRNGQEDTISMPLINGTPQHFDH